MKKIFISVAFVVVLCSHSAFPATVVFGNLGADGSGALGGTTGPFTSVENNAQGFFTGGSSLLTVSVITLGLSNPDTNTVNAVLKLYSGTTNSIGTELKSVTNALTPGAGGTAQFTINQTLAPNSAYWVALGADSANSQLRWSLTQPTSDPSEQNASGYSYLGNKFTTNSGAIWEDDPFERALSISVEAVPEPSTYALLALATSGLGWHALRRRRR